MNVAIVSYFAPPQPAVASHRVLRLTRALAKAGHAVHWVTLDPRQLDSRDETLAGLIPDDVQVHGRHHPRIDPRFVNAVCRAVDFVCDSNSDYGTRYSQR